MKRQFRQRDPRFGAALVVGKFSQKPLQRLGRFLVSLRSLGETFLNQEIAACFLVSATLAQLMIIGQKASMVAQLQPGERSIKERTGREGGEVCATVSNVWAAASKCLAPYCA